MSAWKKPSRMAWRRNERRTVRPSALQIEAGGVERARDRRSGCRRSIPASARARAVRFQSTSGTRKSPSGSAGPAMLSAISEMAAASSRRSISISIGAAQRVDHGDRLQAPRGRMEALDLARGEDSSCRGRGGSASRCRGAGSSRRRSRRTPLSIDDGLVHLGDGGGGDRRAELGEVILELAAERLLDRRARFRHARTAAAGPAGAPGRGRAPGRSRRRAWRGTVRA